MALALSPRGQVHLDQSEWILLNSRVLEDIFYYITNTKSYDEDIMKYHDTSNIETHRKQY